jgi:RND family efflux transporter MFP subunit
VTGRSSVAISALGLLLCACTSEAPPTAQLRPVLTAEVRYDTIVHATRYFGTVQSRFEVDQAFRVGGKVVKRHVDVGRRVREGEVLAVLDDEDYRLAEEATRHQFEAATARAQQAESDWRRYQALKADGSVSDSDDERAESEVRTTRAAAQALARQLDLARNQVEYTMLNASQSGVVTTVRFEVGQVVAAGQAVIGIANEDAPEIVVDVPESDLQTFETARHRASLASAPDESFDVVLRELSARAERQTRTYRARLEPATPRLLPLGATATLVSERIDPGPPTAAIPGTALTQRAGEPAVWVVHRAGTDRSGSVELTPVVVRGYQTDEVLISGPPAGTLVVTAGVQKMSPGLRVALTDTVVASTSVVASTGAVADAR